ncbi:hypothetical protein FQN50_000920 [Emmonsiellopsis sp. PD_5]|nr:hypothetical protein FQN50_000920 [Emmonsiellopsis sp. PD_5]
MVSRVALTALLAALAEARFGQEQIPVDAVASLQAGEPGQAQTLAGQVPGVLLGGADPCEKLALADQIVADLGDGADVLEAAKGLVAAEQNFNPFNSDVPAICGDAALPATEALRGIVPLVDPDVEGSETQNANSATSLETPFDATGLSVADVMSANGFVNFNVAGAAAGGAAAGDDAAAGDAAAAGADACAAAKRMTRRSSNLRLAPRQNNATCADAAANNAAAGGGAAAGDDAGAGDDAAAAADTGAADFGACDPSIKFEGGLGGRPADEFTFQAIDPLVAEGQQEALNPSIIMNRVCDQLTNVCEANAAAVTACEEAQALAEADGTRDQTTADTFNQALGF